MSKNKKKKKITLKDILWKLIFLIGILVLLYPIISRWYYTLDSKEQVEIFNQGKSKIDKEEIDRRIGLAKAYNDALSGVVPEDPFAKEKQEAGKREYARMLEVEEMIGHIEIPKINQDLPIYAGTSEDVLQIGVGHLEGTSLPIGGNNTHTVLTAHRGLPEKTLFTNIDQLKIGDKFYIHNIKETLAYQVDQIKVIEPTNFEDLMIFPGHDYATLLTCTPFMINSHRLLVRGHRVEYVESVDEELIKEAKTNWIFRILFFIALIIIIILLFRIRKLRKENNKTSKKIDEIKNQIENLGKDDEVK
ncbi:class C sortase [Anaerococcus sp. AGMB00486]|uniref:Class C sortase n=2 Tax=Anaerococcus TaxID=165779 RepID=A0ABX2N8R2_9FIRM|nr:MULTISPECIES: class C sortase [Anaerococcus]MDY3006588.1 class C sortase [Anaerococcus porci]MSS77428.1 class C sortase [Anaerococcus porci]NVF11087.1 class C sortase [Anaerococcus faecalis]